MKNSKRLLALNIFSLIVFIFLLLIIQNQTPRIDLSVNSLIANIQISPLLEISSLLGFIFDTKFLIFFIVLLACYTFFRGLKRESFLLALAALAGGSLVYIAKEMVQRARPLNSSIIEKGFSFPSGHATLSLLFFGMLLYLTYKKIKTPKAKFLAFFLISLLILIISFSRIYLNVHWLTDILAGLALGTFILTSFIIFDNIIKND